jgi:hypothetical protein
MRIRARRHNEVSTEGLIARLRAAPPHPDLADLAALQVLRDTPRGTTLRGRRGSETWSVAIKLFAGPHAAAGAKRLYDKHRDVHACCGADPTFSVPEPLAAFDDPPGYAMRYVGGRSGVAILRTAILRRQRTAEGLVDRAGRWLRSFHLRSGLRLAPLRPGRLLAELGRRLDPADSAAPVPFREAFADHLALLRETLPVVRGQPFPVAAPHGDFNLQNLIFERDRTWSCDFSAVTGPRAVSGDVACLLFFLELRDRWRVSDRRDSPGGFDTRAMAILGRAYPELPWHSAETAWLLLQHQLRYWSSLEARRLLGRADAMLEACASGAETLRARAARAGPRVVGRPRLARADLL